MKSLCSLPVIVRKLSSPNHYTNNQKHNWDAEKKYEHLNSLFICVKYVTRSVTTQAFRLRLTTFNSEFLGAAIK